MDFTTCQQVLGLAFKIYCGYLVISIVATDFLSRWKKHQPTTYLPSEWFGQVQFSPIFWSGVELRQEWDANNLSYFFQNFFSKSRKLNSMNKNLKHITSSFSQSWAYECNIHFLHIFQPITKLLWNLNCWVGFVFFTWKCPIQKSW